MDRTTATTARTPQPGQRECMYNVRQSRLPMGIIGVVRNFSAREYAGIVRNAACTANSLELQARGSPKLHQTLSPMVGGRGGRGREGRVQQRHESEVHMTLASY